MRGWWRLWVLLGAVALSGAAVGAQGLRPAAPLAPSEGLQWRTYALQLEGDLREKAQRLALCAATGDVLRAEVDRLSALAGAKKEPAAPAP